MHRHRLPTGFSDQAAGKRTISAGGKATEAENNVRAAGAGASDACPAAWAGSAARVARAPERGKELRLIGTAKRRRQQRLPGRRGERRSVVRSLTGTLLVTTIERRQGGRGGQPDERRQLCASADRQRHQSSSLGSVTSHGAVCVALTLVVYCLNMFGDAVRDLLDPRLRGSGSGAAGLGTGGHERPRHRRRPPRPAKGQPLHLTTYAPVTVGCAGEVSRACHSIAGAMSRQSPGFPWFALRGHSPAF